MIVYTAHIGDTDPLLEPLVVEEGVDYICYTDRDDLKSDVWEMIRTDSGPVPYCGDSRHLARVIKIQAMAKKPLGHISIWIDGTYQLLLKPSEIVQHLGNYDMLAMAHPFRDDIIAEGAAIIDGHGEDINEVDRQIRDYRGRGFKLHQPALTTTGLLVRRHNGITNNFCQFWMSEVSRCGHLRDQMSVDFCVQETDLKLGYLYGHYRNNPYVQYYHHGGAKAKLLNITLCEAPGREFVNHGSS